MHPSDSPCFGALFLATFMADFREDYTEVKQLVGQALWYGIIEQWESLKNGLTIIVMPILSLPLLGLSAPAQGY